MAVFFGAMRSTHAPSRAAHHPYIGDHTFPGYTAVDTVILNLVIAIVFTPVFNAMGMRRTPVDETVAGDYHA
jgi:hypothetical protein